MAAVCTLKHLFLSPFLAEYDPPLCPSFNMFDYAYEVAEGIGPGAPIAVLYGSNTDVQITDAHDVTWRDYERQSVEGVFLWARMYIADVHCSIGL